MTVGLLQLLACADDGSEVPQGNTLHLQSVTRADGDVSSTHLNEGHILMYVTANGANPITYTYDNTGTGWGNVGPSIKEDTQYYLYGYMPASIVDTDKRSLTVDDADLNGDYSKGANLTLGGLPIFTEEDICVVVRAQRITSAEDNPDMEDQVEAYKTTGSNFAYLSGSANENYVNLLMDHLYVQLQLRFNVESEYYALRHIHLKSVKLRSSYGPYVNATVKFRNGKRLTDHVGYATTGPDTQEFTLLTGGDMELASTEASSPTALLKTVNCPHCLFDVKEDNDTYLTIESTYDVYDNNVTTEHPNGNLIRQNCTVTNRVKRRDKATPGMRKTLTLTVAPTYLYMLSEPDLDNPTVKIN